MPAEFVIHSLRHSFCTRLGEAGDGAFEMQRMTEHHSITISERYMHPTPDVRLRAMARLDTANAGLAAREAGQGCSGDKTATRTATGHKALAVSH